MLNGSPYLANGAPQRRALGNAPFAPTQQESLPAARLSRVFWRPSTLSLLWLTAEQLDIAAHRQTARLYERPTYLASGIPCCIAVTRQGTDVLAACGCDPGT
jgi:hypothetical protein